jgi:hypothetical protein
MGVWESAEGIKPPSASTLLHAGYPPLPQPLHGFAKGRCAIKHSPFAGCWEMGSLKVLWPTGRSGSAWSLRRFILPAHLLSYPKPAVRQLLLTTHTCLMMFSWAMAAY